MRTIPLTQGMLALIDDGDYDAVASYKWYAVKDYGTHYAVRNSREPSNKRHLIYMHRVLVCPPKGVHVDHIDGDGLNNTRTNLRLATQSLNQRNQHRRNPKRSGLPMGVANHRGKYQAQIHIGRRVHLGTFNTIAEASVAYQAARAGSLAMARERMA